MIWIQRKLKKQGENDHRGSRWPGNANPNKRKMYQEIFAGLGQTAEICTCLNHFEIIDNNMVAIWYLLSIPCVSITFLPFYGKVILPIFQMECVAGLSKLACTIEFTLKTTDRTLTVEINILSTRSTCLGRSRAYVANRCVVSVNLGPP